ncbi:MAG: caspase family protein [Saprospiraceae bacterium]
MKKEICLLLSICWASWAWGQGPALIIPTGHSDGINSADFSPNGQLFLTGGNDRSVRLWDLDGRELMAYYPEDEPDYMYHRWGVSSVAFLPGGQYLYAKGDDWLEVWDLSGKKRFANEISEAATFDLAMPCGHGKACAASTAPRMLVRNWEWGWSEDSTYQGRNPGPITMMNFQRDTFLRMPSPGLMELAFAPSCNDPGTCPFDNRHPFLTVNNPGTVTVYAMSGDILRHYAQPGIKSAGFTPDGKLIYYRTADRLVFKDWQDRTVFDKDFSEGAEFKYIPGCPAGLPCKNDSPFVILENSMENDRVSLWDADGKILSQFEVPELTSVDYTLSCSDCPAGGSLQILTAAGESLVELRNPAGQVLRRFHLPKDSPGHYRQVQFAPDGKHLLATGLSWDGGEANLWHIDGTHAYRLLGQEKPLKAFFTDRGGIALFTDRDSRPTYIDLLTQQVQLPPPLPENEELKAFSPSGDHILSRTQVEHCDDCPEQLQLRDTSGHLIATFLLQQGTYRYYNHSDFTPDGKHVFWSSGDTIRLWDLSGKEIWSIGDDYASNGVKATSVSSSGKFAIQGFSEDRGSFFSRLDNMGQRYFPENNEGQGFYTDAEGYAAVTFSNDDRYVLLGDNEGRVWLADLNENEIWSKRAHHNGVTSVAIASDNRFALSASYDGSAKLWDFRDGTLLATIIPIGQKDWVCKTPDGLFDASPGAMQMLYYFYSYRNEPEIIELEQLKARYYEPGLLQKVLGYSDESIRPVENFDTVALYPKIILAQIDSTGTLHLHLSERNGGIGKVSIFINGKEVEEEANPLPRRENAKRDSVIHYDLKRHQNYLFRHPDSTNTVSIRVYNEAGWLKSAAVNLNYKVAAVRSRGSESKEGKTDWQAAFDPKLYVITIGTSDYSGTKLDLQYGDQDATMMAKALQAVGTALVGEADSLEVHCLTTASSDSTGVEGTPISWQPAGKRNIRTVFEQIKDRAKAEDIVIVYLSGHGVTQGGTDQTLFYYLTKDVASEDALADPVTRREYAISSDELTKWLTDIPALKQVLIIDACHSGQIVENLTGGTKALNSSQIRALDRMKDRTGMFVLSGSAADKVSYEAGQYGQGLLTYALLQGMLGVAARKDEAGQETIDVMKLFQYARDEVPKLAGSINGIQTPMLGFPSGAASFDIGLLDDMAKQAIPIGNKKPVMIRPDFMNQNTFQDDLQLEQLLEMAFRQETQKGKDADLIYVDVFDYPGAYSVSGLYETTEEEIRITVKLFKDRKDPVVLDLRPTDDPERLVRSIMREIKRLLSNK